MQYDENAEKYGYEGEMTPLKCDKLTAYKGDVTIPVYGTIADAEVYLKKDVDEAIAELKDKCQMHNFFWEGCGFAKRGFKNSIAVSEAFDKLEAENAELKQKLESVQASMYCDVVDANMEIRRLKRALWLARAYRAKEMCQRLLIQGFDPKWEEVERKCLKKAEEYK